MKSEVAVVQIGTSIERWCRTARNRAPPLRDAPCVIGICGAQGSGKSTLSARLYADLEARGLRTAVAALDDFYLPIAARRVLAESVHPLLRTRGVPGTHDVGFALRTLRQLGRPGVVAMPVFDKALDDRTPQSAWRSIAAPVDVILFEGWCVGARPQTEAELALPVNELEAADDPMGKWRCYVNRCLAEEYAFLFARIDRLILLEAPAFEVVYQWRAQQEDDLRRRVAQLGTGGHAVMTDDELTRFINHYERLTRHIMAEMPQRADLIARLGWDRAMTLFEQGAR